MYTVKKLDNRYELFITQEATTPEGETVNILQSIGTYTIESLESQIETLQFDIDSLREKLEAINSFNL